MEIIKNIFYNTDECRVRALVRILFFMGLFVLFMVLQRVALGPIRDSVLYFRLINVPVSFILFSLLLWISVKLFDRRKISGYGLFFSKEWIYDFIFGLLLGIFLISFVFVLEYVLGWISIVDYYYVSGGKNFFLAIIESVFIYIYVGYYEEAFSRGYLLKNISEGMNFKRYPRLNASS